MASISKLSPHQIMSNSSTPLILPMEPSASDVELATQEDIPESEGKENGVELIESLQNIDVAATVPDFDPDFLQNTRRKSCSRRNFAVNLVRSIFSPEEMARSNCSGTRGKEKLDEERLAAIRRATFLLWPLQAGEIEKKEWYKCMYGIDEACRRLNRPRHSKKDMFSQEDLQPS